MGCQNKKKNKKKYHKVCFLLISCLFIRLLTAVKIHRKSSKIVESVLQEEPWDSPPPSFLSLLYSSLLPSFPLTSLHLLSPLPSLRAPVLPLSTLKSSVSREVFWFMILNARNLWQLDFLRGIVSYFITFLHF